LRLAFTLLFVLLLAPAALAAEPVTVFIAGDSTAANKAENKRPETGWGEQLQKRFDEKRVRIDNHAANGRSTRTFISEGRWQALIDKVRGGDYVLITMADGSDEPAIVDGMVALAREGADVVAASRYMRGGHQLGGPMLKRLMSRTAGLTLHWFAGVATHDPTNNFKLYARRFLDTVTIDSTAGFELALELTVKATLDGRRVAEVPTTWRDRTAGQSNFKLRKWLPHYLDWYRRAFVGRWLRPQRRATR